MELLGATHGSAQAAMIAALPHQKKNRQAARG
jgi:hypothetical protein